MVTAKLKIVQCLIGVLCLGLMACSSEATLRVGPGGLATLSDGGEVGLISTDGGLAVVSPRLVVDAPEVMVYIDDNDSPTRAQVRGVAECYDLAVIQLAESDDEFPALSQGEDVELTADQEVEVRSFDPVSGAVNHTPARVSQIIRSGQNGQAAYITVSAPVSGGGLVLDDDGELIGFTYPGGNAGWLAVNLRLEQLTDLFETLQNGVDPFAIGLTGQPLEVEHNGQILSGVGVRAVQPESPAQRAGIQAGDLLTHLGGNVLAEDGTLRLYCDTLTNRPPQSELGFELTRLTTGAVLTGTLYGEPIVIEPPTPATPTAALTPTVVLTATPESTATPTPASPYILAVDDLGLIEVEIPAEWSAMIGPSDSTAARIGANEPGRETDFISGGVTFPGLWLVVSRSTQTPTEFLDSFGEPQYLADCVGSQRLTVNEPGGYSGVNDVYVGCGPENSTIFVAAFTRPQLSGILVSLIARDLSQADLDHLLETLQIDDARLP